MQNISAIVDNGLVCTIKYGELMSFRFLLSKVKIFPYTFVRMGVPVREDTYPEPSSYEVGWAAPFLTASISPMLPPCTHSLVNSSKSY